MTRREAWPAILGLPLAGCDKLWRPIAVDKAPASNSELELDYAILLNEGNGKVVNETHKFQAGDRFRVQFRPGFPAYVYLANRGADEAAYSLLYPNAKIATKNPMAAGQTMVVPGGSDWYTLDEKAGAENLMLIAAAAPVAEFEGTDGTLERDEFERRVAMVERDRRPRSFRRVEDKDEWVRLYAGGEGNGVIVARMSISRG
jgi:hypothetical protein